MCFFLGCAHAIAGRVGFLPVLVTRTALEELSTINHKNERILRKSADLFVIPSVFCDIGGDFLRRLPSRREKTRSGRAWCDFSGLGHFEPNQ